MPEAERKPGRARDALRPADPEVTEFQRLVGEIFRFNGRLLDVAESVAGDLDVTSTRWQLVMVIRERPLSVSQISRRIGIARQSLQVTANRLEERGIVEYLPNPDHARSRLVSLTPAGVELMQELLERQARLTEIFVAGTGYDSSRIAALADALRELRKASETRE